MFPVLVSFSGLEVRSFGVMVLVAWGVGRFVARRRTQAAGLDDSTMSTCWFWGLIAALVGARLPGLVWAPPEYDKTRPVEFFERIQQSGLSSVFALAAAGLATVGILFVNRKSIGQYADAAVAGVFVFLALCRLGCFLNGCCYGVATEAWWGCVFEEDSPAGRYAITIPEARLVPTQLVLAAGNLGLAVLSVFFRPFTRVHGATCCAMTALYVVVRLLVSCWRVE